MPSTSTIHDLVVVGLGAFGSATLHHAAALGLDVVGIDRHDPPHDLGSSHAETRVTRLAVGEGDHYVPFARRSHELWRELEADGDETLLHDTGGLIIAPAGDSLDERWGDFVGATEAVAARARLGFDRLDLATARRRFPGYRFSDDEAVGFEPGGGLVMAEFAVAAHLASARRAGATTHTDTVVTAIDPTTDGATVRTVHGDHRARQVIVCAGPWTAELADAAQLRVTRQEVYWFEADLDLWRSDDGAAFAIWARADIGDYLGVFAVPPNAPLQAVKLVPEQFDEATTPDLVDRTITDADVARFHERMVVPRLVGVSDRCVHRAVCLYTNTTDDHFLIDRHEASDAVTIVSACSGHGFKHSAAVGEALARRAAGLDHLDLEPFRRDRRRPW